MGVPYPNIDPIAFSLGPLPIRWYALGYIGGIAAGWFYLTRLIANASLWAPAPKSGAGAGDGADTVNATGAPLTKLQLDDVVFWVALGIMLGGRLGYVLFYEPALLVGAWEPLGSNMNPGFLKNIIGWLPIPPALMLWKGGMSFHGGLIGVTIAGFLFCRQNKLNPLSVGDLFACAAPIGIFLVRIANFINAELYGRPWDGPWSMVFPTDPLQVARHPSQLYEAALEGLLLFAVIRIASHSFQLLKRPGAITGVFLAGYALSRIIVENFREPDSHMPDFPLGVTMGMILSTPMLAFGLWLIYRTRNAIGATGAPAK